MKKLMSRFGSLCTIISVLSLLCAPLVRSERDGPLVIQQVTGDKESIGGVCLSLAAVSCPVTCFRVDPVCGMDGVTYWCGCSEATCHGVEVAKMGACEVGNDGSAPLPGQTLLLVHTVWLFLLGFSLLFGLF